MRQLDAQFLLQQLAQGASVAQIDPLPAGRAVVAGVDGRVFLVRLRCRQEHPVVALGPAHGRGEPDLPVGGLFVDHVGAVLWVRDCEDAGLGGGGNIHCVRIGRVFARILKKKYHGGKWWEIQIYRIFNFDAVGAALLKLLQRGDECV